MSNSKTAEKSINIVTMKDGRQVDFGARFKLRKSIQIVGEGASRIIQLWGLKSNGTKTYAKQSY